MTFTPRNVAAHTAMMGYQTYPPYISINERRPGFIDIHVRSSEEHKSAEASIELSQADFDHLIEAALRARCERAGITVDVVVHQGVLMIHVPLDLLAFAAEHGPFQHSVVDPDTVKPEDRFRVVDPVVFGKSVARELLCEQGEDGLTLVHQMLDDAIEQVVESGELGFVWPAAGLTE